MRISDWSSDVCSSDLDLLELAPEERARAGIFLAFQYPVEIPGVSTTNFLKTAVNELRKARGEEPLDAVQFLKLMKEKMKLVEMNQSLLSRSLNEGFSGGEKKRNEIFQMAMRSEEHTSELQSLMRSSYAVFCLKKKKDTIKTYTIDKK